MDGGDAAMRSHDRWLLGGLLIAVIAVAAGGCGDASRAAAPTPPPVVKVEPVVERDVPISAEWVGTLVGYINAQIRSRVRLRSILMTAFAFILGVLPLVISTGAGANSRRILGTTVVGGMLAATLVAIFIIPVTFYVSERFRRRQGRATQPQTELAPISGGTDGEPSADGRIR